MHKSIALLKTSRMPVPHGRGNNRARGSGFEANRFAEIVLRGFSWVDHIPRTIEWGDPD